MISNEASTCASVRCAGSNSPIAAFISAESAGISADVARRWENAFIAAPGIACDVIIAEAPRKRGRSGTDDMIRKLKSGEYRLYSRKLNPKTGKRRNLGTFKSRAAAEKHEKAVQYFKRLG